VGSLVPIVAERVGVDPAVLSALIMTLVDATGLIIYFRSQTNLAANMKIGDHISW
jgi:Mg/Co/Ni transporter MgtE